MRIFEHLVIALPAVFFVVDPPGAVPLFIAMTARDSRPKVVSMAPFAVSRRPSARIPVPASRMIRVPSSHSSSRLRHRRCWYGNGCPMSGP